MWWFINRRGVFCVHTAPLGGQRSAAAPCRCSEDTSVECLIHPLYNDQEHNDKMKTLFWGESSTSQIYKDWWVWSLWGCSINYLKITVSFWCDSQIPSSFLNCINKWSELLRVGRKKATGQIIYSATVVKKQSVRTCYEKIQCEEACKHLLPWIQSGNKVLTVLAVASALDSSHRTNAVFATAVPTRGGGLSISTLKCI